MDYYINSYRTFLKENMSENTVDSYMSDLLKFLKEKAITNIGDIAEIKTENIEEYILMLRNKGMAYSSLSRTLASLKKFFAFCREERILSTNPVKGIEVPKTQRKLPNTITPDEVGVLLDAPDIQTIKGMRDKAMLEVMYATGAKVSELINIKVNDISLKNEMVMLSSSGKQRFVPIGKIAAESLSLYIKKGRGNIPLSEQSDILFLNFYGQPLTRQGFWKIVKQYLEIAGVKGSVNAQTLRHCFALHMLNNGADVNSVSEMLGYADVSSTKIYLEVMNNRIKEVYKNAHPRA